MVLHHIISGHGIQYTPSKNAYHNTIHEKKGYLLMGYPVHLRAVNNTHRVIAKQLETHGHLFTSSLVLFNETPQQFFLAPLIGAGAGSRHDHFDHFPRINRFYGVIHNCVAGNPPKKST